MVARSVLGVEAQVGGIVAAVRADRVTPGSQTSLREANRARIVSAVQQRGSLTQIELAGVTGLSPATVSNIVKELTSAGVLHTSPSTRSGRRALVGSGAVQLPPRGAEHGDGGDRRRRGDGRGRRRGDEGGHRLRVVQERDRAALHAARTTRGRGRMNPVTRLRT